MPSSPWSSSSTTASRSAAPPPRTPWPASTTPRTARAAAALATNELRVAYALHPVRLLADLRAPESVPALITTLQRRLRPHDPYRRVALACVEGLGELADPRARPVLNDALAHPALAEAAVHALGRIPRQR